MMQPRTAPRLGVRAFAPASFERVAGSGDNSRRITFIASDETVDRYGDVIRASGWQLDNFRRNNVLLFGHQTRALPIGKVPDIRVEGTRLIADCVGRPEGDDPFADSVWRAIDGGFLNASSVGFMPTADPNPIWAEDDPKHLGWPTGYEFVGQELLELSVVPVPANPQALAVARSLGLDRETQRRLFEDDERAAARVAAQGRRSLLTIARLRPGFFSGD